MNIVNAVFLFLFFQPKTLFKKSHHKYCTHKLYKTCFLNHIYWNIYDYTLNRIKENVF